MPQARSTALQRQGTNKTNTTYESTDAQTENSNRGTAFEESVFDTSYDEA